MIGMKQPRRARRALPSRSARRAASASTFPALSPNTCAIPAFNIVPLPDDIDDELGAILDPLGNAVHTALAFDLVGEDVLITGAGPIGIMAAAVARHVGARHVVITDINPLRLALAAEVADVVPVDVSQGGPRASESAARHEGRLRHRAGDERRAGGLRSDGRHLVIGGRIALLGIPARPPWSTGAVVFKLLTIKGIYGREMFETWHKMIAMLQSGLDVRKVITHRLPAATSCRLRDHAARRVRQDRAGLDGGRRRRLSGGDARPLVAAARRSPRALRVEDAAAAASLIREAFAAQSRATDPPSSALGETTASVAAKLAEGGGAGAEAGGELVGVVLWAEQDGALYIGRVSVRRPGAGGESRAPCWRRAKRKRAGAASRA